MSLGGQPLVALLGDRQLDALVLWQRDVALGSLADDEHVRQTGGEHMAETVLNVDNVEGAGMPFAVDDGADTPQIASSGDHGQVACAVGKVEIVIREMHSVLSVMEYYNLINLSF